MGRESEASLSCSRLTKAIYFYTNTVPLFHSAKYEVNVPLLFSLISLYIFSVTVIVSKWYSQR